MTRQLTACVDSAEDDITLMSTHFPAWWDFMKRTRYEMGDTRFFKDFELVITLYLKERLITIMDGEYVLTAKGEVCYIYYSI